MDHGALVNLEPLARMALLGGLIALGPLVWVWARTRSGDGRNRLRALTLLTLFLTFPAIMNIAALLSLLVFMYAVLGVHLFASLDLHNGHDFQSVGHASEVLLQCMTGGGWSRSDTRCPSPTSITLWSKGSRLG